jgi:hypothetical protein
MTPNNIVTLVCFGLIAGSWTARIAADDPAKPSQEIKSHEQLVADVESLRVAEVAWRSIPWRTCLVEGIRESRLQHKPIMLWIFIDRPIDDARC